MEKDKVGRVRERSKRGTGLGKGAWERLTRRGKAEVKEGVRLHTPPRGLPHSDSPIRMSK